MVKITEEIEERANEMANKLCYDLETFTEPDGTLDGQLIYDYLLEQIEKI